MDFIILFKYFTTRIGETVKLALVMVGVVIALQFIDSMTDTIAVSNKGARVAANGGDIGPYITAMMFILIVALIPGWLLFIVDVDL